MHVQACHVDFMISAALQCALSIQHIAQSHLAQAALPVYRCLTKFAMVLCYKHIKAGEGMLWLMRIASWSLHPPEPTHSRLQSPTDVFTSSTTQQFRSCVPLKRAQCLKR